MRAPSGPGTPSSRARPARGRAGSTDLDFAAVRTSVSVTRPSGPVPLTFARSTPSSAATRRATGEAFTRASSCSGSGRIGRSGAGDTVRAGLAVASTDFSFFCGGAVSFCFASAGAGFSVSAFGFFFSFSSPLFFFLRRRGLFLFRFSRRGFLGFGLRLLFFCCFRLLLWFFFLWRFFAVFTNEGDLVPDVYLATFFDVNLGERSVLG